jgi:hypothetical protein
LQTLERAFGAIPARLSLPAKIRFPETETPLWWRKSEALGEHTSWKFFIVLAAIAGTGAVFFLFVIEPRRKIYD